MAKRKKNKRVYARIISPLRLIVWQSYALLIAAVFNAGFLMWHHEMTMMEIRGKFHATKTMFEVCMDVGIRDCNKMRKSWKKHSND